ncbi:tripartite tricarboxylate transporter substrate binding protein [Ramlibacter albus]|uniref:Tripartite tricarboxylate transporter substrate binding protein n=1 Tax=Ramlibacter albus TaxID=2079448 RepID=A0A923MA50_9BURK|nr:tripartite tricarboxylate transporter substrate binding protein [Ramlibacter albus]MBC5765701.1 tripartite tricarboxylate transporter substrate binding protein [Ramlibacter albus]
MTSKLTRRRIIAAAVLGAFAAGAQAQAPWPSQPVKIIVPFPAGGSTDLTARDVAQALTAKFGQPFVVENRPGAGSTVGTAAVAKAPADGYTFLVTSSHFSIVPGLYPKLPYDPKELRGVSLLVNLPVILVATPSLPVKNVKELIEYAKKNPSKVAFGSSGAGGVNHLSGELFNSLAGTKLEHIPYKGTAPAMQDLIGGHVQLMFDAISTSLPNIRAGLIKPIAWTGATRSPVLQDLPTIAEAGVPGYASTSWLAMFAPAGTPNDIVRKVSDEIKVALNRPELKDKQVKLGINVIASTPEELDATVRSETAQWTDLIRKIGVKAD